MSQQPIPPHRLPEVPTGLGLYKAQVEANAAARQTISDQVMAQVRALVEAFSSWYDDLAVRRLAKDITGVVQAGQRVMAAHEDAYMASVLSSQAGKTVPPVGQVVVDDLRRGVDPAAVYERLGEQFRYARSVGKSPDQSLQVVLERAAVVTETDVTLAARAQDQKSLEATHLAVGYRRVIHPELSKGGTCGMCIAASDRVYKKGTLLPIHARCFCTAAPIMRNGDDPGNSLNNLSLSDLYGDAGGTQATDLKRTRYKIDDHGELGPVLVPKRRAANSAESKPVPKPSEGGMKGVSDDFLSRQLRITEGLKDSPWRTTQLARLRAEIERRG